MNPQFFDKIGVELPDAPQLGRPPLYTDPEVMQAKIDEYFADAGKEKPTMSGLCYFLGFEDRHALAEYEKRPHFSSTVKKARIRVENALESHLYTGQVAGVIFNLKNNFGWKDKQITEHEIPEETRKALWGK